MNEVIFSVEEDSEGGYVAQALGVSIVTQADTIEGLHENVRDAVRCHFEEGSEPKVIRLHYRHSGSFFSENRNPCRYSL